MTRADAAFAGQPRLTADAAESVVMLRVVNPLALQLVSRVRAATVVWATDLSLAPWSVPSNEPMAVPLTEPGMVKVPKLPWVPPLTLLTLSTELGTAGLAVHLVVRLPVSVEFPTRPEHLPAGLATVPLVPVNEPVTDPLVTQTRAACR